MGKKFITTSEVTYLMVNAICIKMFFTFPRIMVINSGNASWLQGIYVSLIALAIFFITMKIYTKCERKTVLGLAEKIGGKWLKIIVGLALAAILMTNLAFTMRAFPESVKTILLPNTPMQFIMIFFSAAVALGAFKGIEAIARLHSIFLPIAGAILVIFLLLLLPYCDVNNLFPILGTGAYSIFGKGFHQISIFADIILLNILLPYCKSQSDAKKGGRKAVIVSGLIVFLITFIYMLVVNYPASKNFVMPVYQLARTIRVGEFFQRAEAFFEFIWSIGMFLYASFYVFIICVVFQKSFDLKYYRPLIIPVVLIMSEIAFIPSALVDEIEAMRIVSYLVYPVAYSLPIIMALFYYMKQKRRKSHEKA
jgi:spore germination protein KB